MSQDDELALRRLLHECADAVCRQDAERWAGLWLDDGVWELDPGRRFEGRHDVAAAWKRSMARYTAVVHLYLTSSATIQGDRATGRAYLVELLRPVTDGPRMITGYYDDVYRRTPDGWRFAQRVLHLLYTGPLDPAGRFLLDQPPGEGDPS